MYLFKLISLIFSLTFLVIARKELLEVIQRDAHMLRLDLFRVERILALDCYTV